MLTEICIKIDDYHHKIFDKYKNQLNLSYPSDGFLVDDCFTPSGEEECYPVITRRLDSIVAILRQLGNATPAAVHKHLRQLHDFISTIEKLHPSQNEEELSQKFYQEMQIAVRQAKMFLEKYSYKLRPTYKANNAILLMCLLFESAKQAFRPNVAVDAPILMDTQNRQTLTLATIANRVCQATDKTARNLQFIAIGITSRGEVWVTTNYHTPIVYPLSCLLSDQYKEAEKFRHEYKVANRYANAHELNFSAHIHAETMIASLKNVLDIKYILLVDGSGKKVENCPYCAHYLCTQGFGSEPHMEAIQNYETPTDSQIKAVTDFAFSLREKFNTGLYTLIQPTIPYSAIADQAITLGKNLLKQIFMLLPYDRLAVNTPQLDQIFSTIKEDYPFLLDNSNGLKETYHLSRKLAHPETDDLPRTIIRKTRSSKRHPNCSLRLFDDGRLILSQRGNRLESHDPSSPRTNALAELANRWLEEKGDPSVNFLQENGKDIIALRR